jgi:hypothetical protein
MCYQSRHSEDRPFNRVLQGTLEAAQRQGNVGAAVGLDEATLRRRRGTGRRRLQMPHQGGVQAGGGNSCSARRRRTGGGGPTDAPPVVRVGSAEAGVRNAANFWKRDDRAAFWRMMA